MKRASIIIFALLFVAFEAYGQQVESTKTTNEVENLDSSENPEGGRDKKQVVKQTKKMKNEEFGRKVATTPIVPKGEWIAGISLAYQSVGSHDSEYLLLLDGLNSSGVLTSVAPIVGWFYKNNNCVGLKFSYSNARVTIDSSDMNIEGLDLSIDNFGASRTAYSAGIFQRSYVSLDKKGQFGLFNDVCLAYSKGKTYFGERSAEADKYTLSDAVRLTLNPGLVIFVTPNLSIHTAIGVGGFTLAQYRNFENGVQTGKRTHSKANLRLNVTDISLGVVIHLW